MSTTVRLNGASNRDNTDAVLLNDFQEKTYAASIALVTRQNYAKTTFRVAQCTGALTLTIGVGTATTDPQVGDTCRILLSSDATGRVVTFSTGFASSGTLTMVASKAACADFIFNGTAWQETGRSIGA
jgi:hypothetical protein